MEVALSTRPEMPLSRKCKDGLGVGSSLARLGLFCSLPFLNSGHLVTRIAPEAPCLFKKI